MPGIRGFHSLIPGTDDWNYDMIVLPEILDVYTDGFKLDHGVGSSIYSGKLDLNIFLRLPDYCSVFQAAQCILANGVSFTRVLIFSDSQ